MTIVDAGAAEFEAARPKLMAIAYRMLGSVREAEDVVGDVALRWAAADRDGVRIPEAWLVTVTTRRALDVLRSARLQRESYPGVWLPEPIATGDGPAEEVERIESLTMGFLVLLERLTPIERAVFVLHDVLAYPYATIAEAVGRSEAACRQALRRARHHVTLPQRRTAAERAHAEQVAQRFLAAGVSGDVDALVAVLAPDIVFTSDGGGVVHAAMRPITGAARVGQVPDEPGRSRRRRPARRAVRAERRTGRRDARDRRLAGHVRRDRRRPGRADLARRQPGQARAPRRRPPGRRRTSRTMEHARAVPPPWWPARDQTRLTPASASSASAAAPSPGVTSTGAVAWRATVHW